MSQQDVNKKVIDGHTFEVLMMPPMPSHRLLMKLLGIIGPAASHLVDREYGNASSSVLDEEVTGGFFAKVISSLFDKLDCDVTEEIINAMKEVSSVSVAEKKMAPLASVFDVFFAGKLDLMYKWLIFAMQVQWGKCFSVLGSQISSQDGP